MNTRRVGLLAFEGCDLLDLVGPYEVLLTANRLAVRAGAEPPFAVVTVALGRDAVHAYGGLGIVPSHAADDVGHLDVLVVPGTIDVDGALADAGLLAAIAQLGAASPTVTSVCTGSFLLAAAGLTQGRPVTTHHEDLPLLRQRDDVGEVRAGVRWVDDGDLVTAGGIASGLAFGLHLVDRFVGPDAALAAARQLEYAWDPEGTDAVPDDADEQVR